MAVRVVAGPREAASRVKAVVGTLMHWRLIVDRSPAELSAGASPVFEENQLEEKDMRFWLVDFVVLPAQALSQVSIHMSRARRGFVPV